MRKLYPLNDDIGSIELIGQMGTDLTIVNDARVSYGREKQNLDEKDIKLIDYLLKHQHYSPLRGVVFKFLVVSPLFVCRQWWRHAIASCFVEEQRGWNEQSLRYVEVDNKFYIPDMRSQSTTNKQGSGAIVAGNRNLKAEYSNYVNSCYLFYLKLLEKGISKEIARTVLPATIYTQFRWTVSLQSLLYFIELRNSPDSQFEIQQYALALCELIENYVPHAFAAYQKYAPTKTTTT